MANPLKGQIEFDLAGKSYKARLTIEAIVGIESALDMSLLKVAQKMSEGDVSITHIINILHPALRGGGNDMSMQQVMSLVDDLYFDYDRMSTSGQDTLDKIAHKLDVLKQGEQSNE